MTRSPLSYIIKAMGGGKMPTNKPHFSIVMDEALLAVVEDFQKENHIKSRGKAINALLKSGVAAILEENKKAASDRSDAAERDRVILDHPLDALTETLRSIGIVTDGDISDADLAFLEAMFAAMKALFQKPEEGRK